MAAILDAARWTGKRALHDDAERAARGRPAPTCTRCCAPRTWPAVEDVGDDVTFVVCRNINFTNVCYVGCSFCGFSRHKDEADAYDHPMEVLLEKCRDAVARGATEVCIQGGIHPNKDHTHYREILEAIKAEFPDLHIHAFSPEEIDFGHRKSGMELSEYLRWLVDAGLGTMPGTAAEILDDDDPQRGLSPRKLKRDRWVEIVTGRPRHRAALDLDADVRPHREPRQVAGSPRAAPARHPEARPAASPSSCRSASSTSATCSSTTWARVPASSALRGPAAGGGGAALPAALDHQRPGVVGEDGPEARPDGADGRAPTTSAAR